MFDADATAGFYIYCILYISFLVYHVQYNVAVDVALQYGTQTSVSVS